MRRRLRLALLAFGIGVLITAITATVAFVPNWDSAESVREAIFWPNTLLQNLVPVVYGLPNIGTPDHPLYEGTPVNILAFFISFPLAIFVYSIVAYIFLRWRRRVVQMTQQT